MCTAIYAWPRPAGLRAVLLTGYLGGANATQLRVGAPLFSHSLFGAHLGAMLWGGLLLRRPYVARLLGLDSTRPSTRLPFHQRRTGL